MSPFDEISRFDALAVDLRNLNDHYDVNELNSALHQIFPNDHSNSDQIRSNRKNQNRSSNKKQVCSQYGFFSWCGIIVIGLALSYNGVLYFASDATIHGMDTVLTLNAPKMIRKAVLSSGLKEVLSVTDADFDECVVDNPVNKIWLAESPDCKMYDGKNKIWILKGRGTELGLKQLQQIIVENSLMLSPDVVSANRPYIREVEDLAKNDVQEQLLDDAGVHIVWKSSSRLSSNVLRQAFPHPHKLMEKSILRSPTSLVFIDGPDYPIYLMPLLSKPVQFHCMYVQASGSRRLILSPVQSCAHALKPQEIIMKEKDVLLFEKQKWIIHSEPYGDSLSISYVGQFQPF